LITFSVLAIMANGLLISPIGKRDPQTIHRIVREKARVQGAMASIVEWQSLKMQEYRYQVLVMISRFWNLFGVRRPVRYDPPISAGDYDQAVHSDYPYDQSFLVQYLESQPLPEPRVGGKPKETALIGGE
jgi:hypothetical protein